MCTCCTYIHPCRFSCVSVVFIFFFFIFVVFVVSFFFYFFNISTILYVSHPSMSFQFQLCCVLLNKKMVDNLIRITATMITRALSVKVRVFAYYLNVMHLFMLCRSISIIWSKEMFSCVLNCTLNVAQAYR